MANLGKLWFELGLKDRTDKEITEIRKGIEKRLKDLDVDIGLNGDALKTSIENALRGQKFKIDVEVSKANTNKLIQEAINRAGINPNISASDVRAQRIEEINKRIQNSYDESRVKIEKLQTQIKKLRGEYNNTSSSANKYSRSLDGITNNLRSQFNIAGQLRNQIANIYSVYTAERFLKQVIKIGGEFQQQRIALQAIYKDAAKADALFGQIKQLAVVSPFEFKDLASYTKQLSAFSIPYNEIYDTTKRLADISAGLGVDMGRIILAYGQVRSASFLRGQEVRQFTEAGIPLLDKLAEKFTEIEGKAVSVGEVFDKISNREVPFQMVKDVLWDLTNEGGQFYNMQEKLANSLAGKLSNLRDAYNIMLADIAQSNNSTLSKGLDLLTDTMKNWEELSKYILSAAMAYGTYKAALIAVSAIEKARSISDSIRLIIMFRKELGLLTAAQKAFNLTALANPYVAIATGLAFAVGSITLFYDKAKTTDEMITDLNESFGKLKSSMDGLSNNDKLIDEYERLANKQDKTSKETKRLESLTKTLSITFKGAVSSVDEYGMALSMSVDQMRNLSKEQKGALTNAFKLKLEETENQLRNIQEKIKRYQDTIKKTNENDFLSDEIKNKNIAKYKSRIDELRVEEIKLQNTIYDINDDIESLNKNTNESKEELNGWRKAISDFVSGKSNLRNLVPKETEEYADWFKRLKDELSDAKDELARKEKTEGLFSEDDIKAARNRVQEIQTVVDKFNISISDKKKGKDPIAERFQKEVDLMKAAMDTYNEYVSLLGKEGAIKAVNEDTRFAGLNFNPDTFKESLKEIQAELQKVMGDNKDRIKVNDSIKKIFTDIDVNEVKTNIDQALKVMRSTIEDNIGKWNLYKDLFSITGNREMSLRFAFGADGSSLEGIYSQADYLKKQLLDLTGKTYDELKNLSDKELKDLLGKTEEDAKNLLGQIRSTTKQETDAIVEDVIQLVQKYASTEDKIKSLQSQRDAKLEELRNTSFYKGLNQKDKNAAEDAIFKDYAKQIQTLREESIKLSPVWQKLFGDTAALGYSNMKKVVSEAKKMIDTAEEVKNPKTGESQYSLSYKNEDGNIKKDTVSLELYLKLIKQVSQEERSLNEQNPFKGIKDSLDKYNKALEEGDEDKKKEALASLGQYANSAAQMITGVTDAWSGMFSSLGNEDAADALSFAGDILGELGNLAEGLTSDNPVQMATSALSFIPNIIGKIANFHDKKLDKAIQRSALEVQKLQNAYTNLQKSIERQLGDLSEKQTGEMIQNLQRQRAEIQKQMQTEGDKKKTDKSKIEDYKQQIAELDDQIKYFYEDLAKELYNIDLKDWASQFSNSVVDAWRRGENAAEAFGKTASDILADVANEALKMAIIEPMFKELRDKLPQMMSDGSLDKNELGEIAELLLNIQQGYADSLSYLDDLERIINERTGGQVSLKDLDSSYSSSDKGIQASEETMNLTNSYLNAIRQDVSVKRMLMENIAGNLLPTISITAQAQLQQLNAITDNTRINAEAAKSIYNFLQNTLAGVITNGRDGRAIRIQ